MGCISLSPSLALLTFFNNYNNILEWSVITSIGPRPGAYNGVVGYYTSIGPRPGAYIGVVDYCQHWAMPGAYIGVVGYYQHWADAGGIYQSECIIAQFITRSLIYKPGYTYVKKKRPI